MMKQDKETIQNIKSSTKDHINFLLKKIKSSTKIKMSIDKKKVSSIQYSKEYELLSSELIKVYEFLNFKIHIRTFRKTINELVVKKKIPTHNDFISRYKLIFSNYYKVKQPFHFYVPLDHKIEIDVFLNNFSIISLNKEEKIELVEKLKQQSYKEIKTYNFHNTHFYKFSSKFLDYNEIIKEFNEVFNLYKGILEFSFNKKSNFFFQMDERKNSSFQEHLELITSDKLSPDFKELLENCFRLYSMSIDVNTIDQSYLFIWNILESITLSQSGNTDECIKKVMTFCSKQFKEENKFNIETLKKLRNDRVHKGVGNIEISDLNMLKYLVDCSILFLLDNHQIVKNKQYLDVFFSLSENNLDKIKEMVEFKIEYKKQLNT